jgi:hypothetical protein
LTTNSIINSQDIIWLNKAYKEWKEDKPKIFNVEDDILELPTGVADYKPESLDDLIKAYENVHVEE